MAATRFPRPRFRGHLRPQVLVSLRGTVGRLGGGHIKGGHAAAGRHGAARPEAPAPRAEAGHTQSFRIWCPLVWGEWGGQTGLGHVPKEPGISWAARDPLWGGGEERRRGPRWQLWPRLFPSVAATMCPPHSHLSSRLHAQGLLIQSHRRPHKCSRAHRPAARPPPFPAQGLGLPSLGRPIQSLEKASHLSCGRSVRPRSGVEPDAATCRPHPAGWSPASFEGRHQAPDRAQSCGGPSCWADSLSRGLRGLCPDRV